MYYKTVWFCHFITFVFLLNCVIIRLCYCMLIRNLTSQHLFDPPIPHLAIAKKVEEWKIRKEAILRGEITVSTATGEDPDIYKVDPEVSLFFWYYRYCPRVGHFLHFITYFLTSTVHSLSARTACCHADGRNYRP